MNLSKTQLILLLLLSVFWFNRDSISTPNFTPDLKAADLEALSIGALYVMLDPKPAPIIPIQDVPVEETFIEIPEVEIPKEEVVEKTEEIAELYPRVVLLTQPETCQPCRLVDKNIIEPLKTDIYKKAGWVVDNTSRANLQIIDLDKDPVLFEEFSDKLFDSVNNKDFSINVPTFIRLNRNKKVEKYFVGNMSLIDFIKFQTTGK